MQRFALALSILAVPALASAAPEPPPVPGVAPVAPVAPVPPHHPTHVEAPAPPAPPSPGLFSHAPVPPPPPPVALFGAPARRLTRGTHVHAGPDVSFSFSGGQGRLGAHVTSMTTELRAFFGAPTDAGILVQKVVKDSPASRAGLTVGDVVIAVDGDDVADLGDVREALEDRGKGDAVDLVVIRSHKKRTLSAELDEASSSSSWSRSWSSSSGFPGVQVIPLDGKVAARLEELEQRLEALEGKPSKTKTKTKKKTRKSPRKKTKPTKK